MRDRTQGGILGMAKLAIKGGPQCAKGLKIPKWPIWSTVDKKSVIESINSGKWCRIYPNSKVEQFEKIFAEYQHAKYAICTANGTISGQVQNCL